MDEKKDPKWSERGAHTKDEQNMNEKKWKKDSSSSSGGGGGTDEMYK